MKKLDSNWRNIFFGRIVRQYAILIILIILLILFGVANPKFFSWMNITNIIIQNTYIFVMGVGISFIMMSGTLDLSVGWQVSIIGVLTARLMTQMAAPVWLAILIGIAVGIMLGAFNGGLAVLFNINPMVVTIAAITVFQGISNLISGGLSYTNFPSSFMMITQGSFLGIPIDVWIAAGAVAAASIIYKYTYFGRYVKAMGGNMEATRLAGVNVKLMRIVTFMISGAFVAVASFIYSSKLSMMTSAWGPGLEMTAITAAILGGISFNNGEGKMWGLVVGVFTLAIISNGMQLANWNQYVQFIVKGMIMILAIAFDKYQQRVRIVRKTKAT